MTFFRSRAVAAALAVGLVSATAAASEQGVLDEALPASDWLIATVDASREVGYNVSAAVDPETGHTYISYYEGVDGDLWLARTGAPVGNCGPGNSWECRVLDSVGVVGKYSSIAVGGPGPFAKLSISYHDVTNGALNVVVGEVDRSTGELTYGIEVVEPGSPGTGFFAGTATAAAISDSGSVHVAYQVRNVVGASEVVKHATKYIPGFGNCGPGDGWWCRPIELNTDVGDHIDIDVGPDGDPVVAFYDASGSQTVPVLAWRTTSGGTCSESDLWNCEAIAHSFFDTGAYVSLALDHDGHSHLAYRNATGNSVHWASFVGAFNGNCGFWDGWQCLAIDFVGSDSLPSGIDIEVDHQDRPVIVYQDAAGGFVDLNIARPVAATPWSAANCGLVNSNPTWTCETLDAGDLTHSEAYGGLSVGVDPDGPVAVAYRELFDPIISPERGRLKVALESGFLFGDGFESASTVNWSVVVPYRGFGGCGPTKERTP